MRLVLIAPRPESRPADKTPKRPVPRLSRTQVRWLERRQPEPPRPA